MIRTNVNFFHSGLQHLHGLGEVLPQRKREVADAVVGEELEADIAELFAAFCDGALVPFPDGDCCRPGLAVHAVVAPPSWRRDVSPFLSAIDRRLNGEEHSLAAPRARRRVSVGAGDVELEVVVVEFLAIGHVGFEVWDLKVGVVCCCGSTGECEESGGLHYGGVIERVAWIQEDRK